jgi:hypothetical protein
MMLAPLSLFLESLGVVQQVKKSHNFSELKHTMLCPLEHANGSYSGPYDSSIHLHTLLSTNILKSEVIFHNTALPAQSDLEVHPPWPPATACSVYSQLHLRGISRGATLLRSTDILSVRSCNSSCC